MFLACMGAGGRGGLDVGDYFVGYFTIVKRDDDDMLICMFCFCLVVVLVV